MLIRLSTTALATLILGAVTPAVAQAPDPNLQFQCMFATSPNDCGFSEQSHALPRATVVSNVSRDGTTAVRLRTEPGDINVAGSGVNERPPMLTLRPSSTS